MNEDDFSTSQECSVRMAITSILSDLGTTFWILSEMKQNADRIEYVKFLTMRWRDNDSLIHPDQEYMRFLEFKAMRKDHE